MKTTLALALSLLAATASHAQLDVDVWVGDLAWQDGRLVTSNLVNISQRRGYDNQPAFFPDQKTLAYTTWVGEETNIVLYDLATGTATQLPEAKGFSPTPTADGKQLMVLHQGRVELHDLAGKLVRPLTETRDAGYFSRVDDRIWALFLNDAERRVVIYDAKKKMLETMSTGVITPLYRVPNERAFTFVAETPFSSDPAVSANLDPATIQLELRKLDLARHRVDTLATIPFPATGHHVWTAHHTVLMASAGTIHEWSPAAPERWTAVAKFEDAELQGISRIVLSPRGDRIALVSTPRDETLIRNARMDSNRAIAARVVDDIVGTMEDDVVIIRGNGAVVSGKEDVQKAFAEAFAASQDLVYARTTERVEVSTSEPLAAEHGTWTAHSTTADGKAAVTQGSYLAMWRKKIGTSGLPEWKIRSELFVALGIADTSK
jgi:ketosteroid isomerase-like protein